MTEQDFMNKRHTITGRNVKNFQWKVNKENSDWHKGGKYLYVDLFYKHKKVNDNHDGTSCIYESFTDETRDKLIIEISNEWFTDEDLQEYIEASNG